MSAPDFAEEEPLLVPCSGSGSCGAARGAPCVSKGKQVAPHQVRVKAAQRFLAARAAEAAAAARAAEGHPSPGYHPKKGDAVVLTAGGKTIRAQVALASGNGQSLAVSFYGWFLDFNRGIALFRESADAPYRELMSQREVKVQPAPPPERN